MGIQGPQPVPLNVETAIALPVDAPNPSGGDRFFTRIPDRDNKVTPFFRVFADAYPEMGRILALTVDRSDFIYLCGWDLGLDTGMGGSTFRDLITRASNERGVAVRALLYMNQSPGGGTFGSGGGPPPQNQPSVDFINSLANGGAVHDNRYLNFGSHHQKLLVIKHGANLVAFCGGMDIHPARSNWHDVHVKVEGPAAFSLHQVFVDRWTDHPITRRSNVALRNNTLVAPPSNTGVPGELEVQVVTTYGDGSKHSGLSNLDVPASLRGGEGSALTNPTAMALENASSRYSFAPIGDRGIFNLIAKCISNASRFIYIEDQYLVQEQLMSGLGDSISERLADKLAEPDFKKLVILMAGTEVVNGELHQAWRRRRAFLGLLKATALTKVVACTYKPIAGSAVDMEKPQFVHSKFWSFDDEFCIVSSANCNRRGYTHDSEVGVGIFDPNPQGNRLNFARDLRIRLWKKHLNPNNDPSISERDLLDPVVASRFWRTPPVFALIEAYDESGDTAQPPRSANVSPDRRLPRPFGALTDAVLATADDDWNKVLDPDGS